jgi:hypothetical protein
VHGGRGRDRGQVAGLHAEVQLLAQRRGEAVGQLDHSQVACPRGPLLQRGGDAQDDVQVTVDHRDNPRPLDLDHDLRPGVQRGPVHLADGCGSERLLLDLGKDLVHGSVQLGRQQLPDKLPGNRGDLVLQTPQCQPIAVTIHAPGRCVARGPTGHIGSSGFRVNAARTAAGAVSMSGFLLRSR